MNSDRPNKSQPKLLFGLREALASRSKVTVEFGSVSATGLFVDLSENGSGRSAVALSATILADENYSGREHLSLTNAVVKFHTATDFFEMQASANFIDSGVPLIKVFNFSDVQTQSDRRRLRSVVGSIPKSFIILTNNGECSIASFELRDISIGAAGGIIRTPVAVTLTDAHISGFLSSGNSSLRFNKARIIRFDKTLTKEGSVFARSVAVEIQNANDNSVLSEKRKFVRTEHNKFSTIEIESSLFPGVPISIRITDISTAGFSGKIVDEKDIALLPVGCEITYKGLSGEILHGISELVRVRWTFDSDNAHKVWQETVARLAEHDIDIRSYESQSTLTLLARSGLKNSKFISNYNSAKDMVPSFGEIEKSGDPVVFRAVQRDSSGILVTHVGSFKIADNLWFNGDLFGSQDGESSATKEFVSAYLYRFFEFALASRPYPNIITAWTGGHPYWKKLELSLKCEGNEFIHAVADIHTILPNVDLVFSHSQTPEIGEILPSDFKEISRIRNSARDLGTESFLSAFDFDKDRFGSPVLRMSLEKNNYKFRRNYFSIKSGATEYLAIISNMPEGLSPQRHQNAVWLICVSGKPEKTSVNEIVENAVFIATKNRTFPSVIRVVGPDLSLVTDKKNFVVLADPKLWRLAL